MTKKILVLLGALGLSVASTQLAKADIITIVPIGSPSISGGVATWTYQAELTSDEQLNPGGATEFGTVYSFDFGSETVAITGATGLLANSSDFSFSYGKTMAEAQNQLFTPPTCANCSDIRFSFVGSMQIGGGGTAVPLGTFTVESTDLHSISSFYDGQATNSFGGGLNGNSGNIMVASAVPEPMTFGLLGGGLALLGVARLRRNRKA